MLKSVHTDVRNYDVQFAVYVGRHDCKKVPVIPSQMHASFKCCVFWEIHELHTPVSVVMMREDKFLLHVTPIAL